MSFDARLLVRWMHQVPNKFVMKFSSRRTFYRQHFSYSNIAELADIPDTPEFQFENGGAWQCENVSEGDITTGNRFFGWI